MVFRRIVRMFLGVVLALTPQVMFGQHTSGSINGTVSDAEARVIVGAEVTLTNQDTNIVSHATTNGSGGFVFLNIDPGPYKASIAKPGFRTVEIPTFNLTVNQALTMNETMPVGTATETVQVSTENMGVMLQKSSSELGSVIEAKEIQQLPLNGRNFTSLLILSPGVTPVSTAQGSGISTTDAGISAIPGTAFYKVSFFGQQNRETLYMMDGIVNTDLRGAIYGFLPIIDAMSEFKVQSHIDSAEYGVVTGGIVNMLSKSGTNKFHGSVWEFVRNNAFDARNSFTDFCSTGRCAVGTPTTTPAKPGHYTQNQFGAALGGPVLRDRIFFQGAYEGWRYAKPTLTTTLVPTSQELSGDFSNVATSYYQHKFYNPYSTVCTGGKCTVQQFQCDASGNPVSATNNQQGTGAPCLKIPSSMLNPTMLAYLKAYYAAPNSPGTEASGYNFVENRAQIDKNNSYQVRLDFHLTDKNFGFARVSQMWVYDSQPVAGTIASNVSNYHAYNFGGGFTHVFTPNLLLDVRGGALLKPYVFNPVVSKLGASGATTAGFQNVSQYGGMYINLGAPYGNNGGGGNNLGSSGDSQRGNPVVNGGGSVSWIHGRHTMKAGVDYIYQNRLQRNLFQQFTFSDVVTSNINQTNTGNSLASALLAAPATFTAQTPSNAEVFFNMQLWSGYVQDTWKATPKLMLNLGLRYEYIPGINMLDKRLANSLDIPNQTYTIGASSVPACTTAFVNPCIPGGIGAVPFNDHIKFSNGQHVGAAISDNIGPRFGFAYSWGDKTVINGGVGMFYDTITARSQWVQNNIEGPTWPWTIGISNQQTNIQQSGYWPGSTQNPLNLITNLEGNFPNPVVAQSPWLTIGGGYTAKPDYKDQRSVEWNVQVQQQLAPTTLFSLGYAGSKSTRLNYTGFANAAQHASNPANTTATQVDALKYMPWMAPNWHYSTDTGYANYHALLVNLQKRFSNSLNSIVSYTWSKALDNSSGWFEAENGTGGASVVQNYFDPRNAYGISSYDLRHYFSWSTVYSFPFGRGQKWLQTGVASYVLGGWKANYLFQIRSGQPFNLTVGGDPAFISGNNGSVTGYSRPNVIGNPLQGSCGSTPVGTRGPNGYCMINPAAFAAPVGSYGNMGKMPFRVPTYNNLDFSLVKETPLHEGVNLELRAESFNTYNVVIAGNPGTTIGNASAGVATTQGNTPRQLQFGAKIIF